MEYFNYILIALAVVSILLLIVFALLTKKFFKTVLLSAVGGVVTLLILHFSSSLTGFEIGINPSSVGVSTVLGLPGVIAMVIIKMIFGL